MRCKYTKHLRKKCNTLQNSCIFTRILQCVAFLGGLHLLGKYQGDELPTCISLQDRWHRESSTNLLGFLNGESPVKE